MSTKQDNSKLVQVVKNREEVIKNLSELIRKASDESISKTGVFNIGVSGGSLASFLKEGLPEVKTDFSKWRVFFCDERVVPENSPDSTFGLYKKELIGRVDLKENQFIKIRQGISANEAAEDYYEQMASFFPKDTFPNFDLLLLGMGPDGHTCSLFPGHKLLQETEKWVVPIVDSPKPPPARITLTFPVINNAKICAFAACGKEKAEMIKRILVDKEDLPATRVQPQSGSLVWILDEEAGLYIPK